MDKITQEENFRKRWLQPKCARNALVRLNKIDYAFFMQTFHADTVIEKDGKLHLDDVPFSEGQAVHVFVSPATSVAKNSRAGSVLKFDQPFAPVAEEDWEATQ